MSAAVEVGALSGGCTAGGGGGGGPAEGGAEAVTVSTGPWMNDDEFGTVHKGGCYMYLLVPD